MPPNQQRQERTPKSSPRPRGTAKNHDEKAKDRLADVLLLILVVILLLGYLGKLATGDFLKNLPGLFSPKSSLANISSPVGGKVALNQDATLYATPCGTTSGYESKGAVGQILEGPVYCNGERYWFVQFGDGSSGWVKESALNKEDGSQFDPGSTPIGSAITASPASDGTHVYDTPGGKVIATEPAGTTGTVIGGPQYFNGERYWQVMFADGKTGWVPESELNSSTGGSLNAGDSPVGSGIRTGQGTGVYDTPGGKVIATEPAGTTGTVIGGPQYFNGERYWQVMFADGKTGWVPEKVLLDNNGGAFKPGSTPIGSSALTSGTTSVYDKPGGKVIATEPAGTKGTVVGGPAVFNGERYWQMEFPDGKTGWVKESGLRDSHGGKFNPGNTLVGSSVGAAGGVLKLYDAPGGKIIATEPAGAKGTVVKGPSYFNGERYWYVQFADGKSGWVKESELKDGKGGTFNPGDTPVGSAVVTTHDSVSVYDAPGGRVIGYQGKDSRGVITDGPVFYQGHRYWRVQFDNGVSGWVMESDITQVGKESSLSKFFIWVGSLFTTASIILSLLFLTGIVYSIIRSVQVGGEEHKREHAKDAPARGVTAAQDHVNRRWERVVAHVQSDSPADWRLAILEADIMLAELLDRMGYIGENVGEKLKTIEKSDFITIEDAWEAHKVRNLIAHQGSDFVLSRREAQRVIFLYGNVFREFRYI